MSNEPENSGAWFTSPNRKIIREPLFERQLKGLALSHQRIEEVLAGIEDSIGKFPRVLSSHSRRTILRGANLSVSQCSSSSNPFYIHADRGTLKGNRVF